MSNIVERLKALVNDGTELPFEDIMTVEQAIAEIARLQAELSSLKASAKEARAEALEDAAKVADDKAKAYEAEASDVRNSVSDKRFSAAVAIRLKGVAAAIRRLKEGATPGPVPSLAKLFNDMAAKQRSINDQFDEFMSDVEEKP